MDRDEQQAHLLSEMRGMINRFSVEYDKLSYLDYYGVMMDLLMDLKFEQKYNTPIEWSDDGEYEQFEQEDDYEEEGYEEDETYEDDDGDGWKKDTGSD